MTPPETSAIGDTWPVISFLILAIFAMGGMCYVIKKMVDDVRQIKITLYNPAEPENRLLTVGECNRCNSECKKVNHDIFEKISEKMDMNAETLCAIRIAVGVLTDRGRNGHDG